MELTITEFFNNETASDYSASRSELGDNAAQITWEAALRAPILVSTPEEIETCREFFKSFGAWDDLDEWPDTEINALLVQWISGDIREIESLCMDDNGRVDWQVYCELAQDGTLDGNLFCGDDDQIYYYMG